MSEEGAPTASAGARARPRIGVAGTGWWASTAHLPSLATYPDAELVAVCDPIGDRARAAAERFGASHVFTDVTTLLDADLLDGLVVATPHTTHHAVVRAALDAGVHVLVEKPMTTTAADAWDLVDAAERAGMHLSVGYTYQHTSTAAFVRRAVQSEIGDLICVAAEFASGTQRLFAGGEDPTDGTQPHPMTYADPHRSGGGQGHTQVTHLMGMVNWATGRTVEEVFCYLDNRGLTVDLVDVMAFRFSGGGSGTVTSTGTALDGQPHHQPIRYYGSAGCVEQDLQTAAAVVYRNDGTTTRCQPGNDNKTYPVQAPSRRFADLIAGRTDVNPAPGVAGAATAAFLDAAYRSAATHRPERVLNPDRAGAPAP